MAFILQFVKFAAKWVIDIMLIEISQTEKQILFDVTYMWNLKNTTNWWL